jgi:hypothetical protein
VVMLYALIRGYVKKYYDAWPPIIIKIENRTEDDGG